MTKKFPKDEQFGLTSQIRRAAISIPSNIAEGCGRSHFKESIHFFFISRGSMYELETQVILANDLQYIPVVDMDPVMEHITRCKKLINGFIGYYEKQSNNDQRRTTNETEEDYGNGS